MFRRPLRPRTWWLAAALLVGAGCDSETPDPTVPPVQPPPGPVAPTLPPALVSADIPAFLPVPNAKQLAWHELEMTMLISFGPATYNGTGHGWETTLPDPALVDPTAWDPRQWGRVARETGFGGLIFVAKHHNGFSLWPTETSDRDIALSPFRGGQGDMVREVADAMRAERVPFGVYVSPWDMNEPTYGTPAYNEVFNAQITELLTNYGDVFELWFDGARPPNNPAADAAFNQIDFRRAMQTGQALQPNVMVGLLGWPPDFHWAGNEDGVGQETTWLRNELTTWSPDGLWQATECSVPIRPNWFWTTSEDADVKSVEQLVDIYFTTQGRSCQLLVGLSPDVTGQIPQADVQRLYDFRSRLDQIFQADLAAYRPTTATSVRSGAAMWAGAQATDPRPNTFWSAADGSTGDTLEVDLGVPTAFNVVEIREPIAFGQRVARHRVEVLQDGVWVPVVSATTIGYRRMHRIDRAVTSHVRLVIEEALASPAVSQFSLYNSPHVTAEP